MGENFPKKVKYISGMLFRFFIFFHCYFPSYPHSVTSGFPQFSHGCSLFVFMFVSFCFFSTLYLSFHISPCVESTVLLIFLRFSFTCLPFCSLVCSLWSLLVALFFLFLFFLPSMCSLLFCFFMDFHAHPLFPASHGVVSLCQSCFFS